MKSKRGQFYIIAAILIVVIISSIATTLTYTVTKSAPKGIKELSNELKQEIPRMELYGTYNKADLGELIDNFTQGDLAKYFYSKTDESSMAIVYRNSSGGINFKLLTKRDTGTISVQGYDFNTYEEEVYGATVEVQNGITYVTVLNQTYPFNLTSDKDFYFIIMQNKSGEQYIETG